MRLFVFLVFLTSTSSAFAEYRAFLLEISDPKTDKARQVTSNLDHQQYPTYYVLQPGETIRILDTWMCWERSDHFQEICAPPKRTTAGKTKVEEQAVLPSIK